jgi:hypothetical protein
VPALSAGADPARARLDARVLAWVCEPEWRDDAARFEALALELFAHQFRHCAPYARFCAARGRTPREVRSWPEIPAVPTGAFKELTLRSFSGPPLHVFRTSGTSAARRGELHLDTLEIYEASCRAGFERFVLPELGPAGRITLRVLAPAPDEAPDSSLSHMFGCVLRARGDLASGFDVRGGRLRDEGLLAALRAAEAQARAVVLCGTAFAFVHLLDRLAERELRLRLPPGSRAMETGGFKGRSREVAREELHGALEQGLGIPRARIVNQYGMTELASQFYDSTLWRPGEERRKLGPPWARVRLVDPGGADVPRGEVGRIAVYDLANTGSVLAVQTADLGRAAGDGFEVLGREAGAEARGCSVAADLMLEEGGVGGAASGP